MASINVLTSVTLQAGQHVYPSSGLYTGVDGATDCVLTGLMLANAHVEVELYENDEFAQVVDELTFDGSGFVATGIHGRDGNNDPVAIFPENAGLKLKITVAQAGVATLTVTTSP